MHGRHLRAVFAGAARSQQAAKARHDDAAKRPFPGGEAPLHACLHALRVMYSYSLFINGSVPEILVPFRRQGDVVGDVVGDAAIAEVQPFVHDIAERGVGEPRLLCGAFLSAFLSHDSADWKSYTGNPFLGGPGICRFLGKPCQRIRLLFLSNMGKHNILPNFIGERCG